MRNGKLTYCVHAAIQCMQISNELEVLGLFEHVHNSFKVVLHHTYSLEYSRRWRTLTSVWMYSQTRSFMAGVRHICLIARSISVMHPKAGVGRWPVRMMLAVAGDGSGPIVGEEDMPSRVMKG